MPIFFSSKLSLGSMIKNPIIKSKMELFGTFTSHGWEQSRGQSYLMTTDGRIETKRFKANQPDGRLANAFKQNWKN